MSKKNVEVVHALERAWDSNQLDDIEKYFTDGYTTHSTVPGMPPTIEGFKMIHQVAMAALPDRKVEVLDTIDAGDKVVVRCLMTGTNNAAGFAAYGAPEANGAKLAVEWISIYRLENGKIAEHWAVIDSGALLAQIGAWSPPPMPG